jgi:hypothetical protein
MLMQMLKAAKLLVFFSLVFLLMNVVSSPQSAQNEPLPLPSPVGSDGWRGFDEPTQFNFVSRRNLLMHETFEDTNASHRSGFVNLKAHMVARSEGSNALHVTGDQLLPLKFGYIADVEMSFEAQISQGTVEVAVRHSGAGSYNLSIGLTGLVKLFRWDEELATAQLDMSSPRTVLNVRFSAIGSNLSVYVDDLQLINVIDSEPLPYGTMHFAGLVESNYFIDNLIIYGSVAPEPLAGIDLIATMAAPEQVSGIDQGNLRAGSTSRVLSSNLRLQGQIFT